MDYDDQNPPAPDPSEEELRLENDILKLKMQAEHGATFGPVESKLSPELEYQFLKQAYDFEKSSQNLEILIIFY